MALAVLFIAACGDEAGEPNRENDAGSASSSAQGGGTPGTSGGPNSGSSSGDGGGVTTTASQATSSSGGGGSPNGPVTVEVGDITSCALRDGRAFCWGNGNPDVRPVPGITSAVALYLTIPSSSTPACFVLMDGSLQCRDDVMMAQNTVTIPGVANATSVVTHLGDDPIGFASLPNGTVKYWRWPNEFTQPMDPATTIADLASVAQIDGNSSLFSVVGYDGSVVRYNAGLSSDPIEPSTTEEVAGISTARKVSGPCALLDDGSVRCWDDLEQDFPIPLPGAAVAIASSEDGYAPQTQAQYAVLADGSLMTWTCCGGGSELAPVRIHEFSGVVSISASFSNDGPYFCVAIDDGSVHCRGSNTFGQLGPSPEGAVPIPW